MKKPLSFITRCGVVAIAVSTLGLASAAFAQNETSNTSESPQGSAPEATSEMPTRGMAGIGQKPRKPRPGSSPAPEQATTAAANATTGGGTLSAMDRQFMMVAAKDGMKEVHMGQMAVQQGQSPEIKKLGSMIVADHTKANSQLTELATKRGVKLDMRHKMEKMSKKDMANFDQSWLTMMVMDHQKDIALYQRQAQGNGDPEVKAFAKKTVPVLQKHLKAVQAAQKKMGGATSTAAAGR
jgi:putative membrane protein